MDTAPNNSTIGPKSVSKQEVSFGNTRYNEDNLVLSIAEYRKLLNDTTTPDERIVERINYITSFSRKVIKQELQKYVGRK